jgi:hypothetical protein
VCLASTPDVDCWIGVTVTLPRDTPQRFPRASSESYPSPAAEANVDGSTLMDFAPMQPAAVQRGNWVQTDPNKGWWTK